MAQQTLHDFVLSLLSDYEALSAFKLDPQSSLDKAGLADLTPQDVHEAIPLVMDYADSSLSASFIGGLDGAATSGILTTPAGDYATGLGVLANGDDGPVAVYGLDTPYGGVLTSVSSSGIDIAATGDFSALADLSDTLDAEVLGVSTNDVVAETMQATNDLMASDLTSGELTGTNGAASLMTAGASATAGLVGTGTDLTMGALTNPVGATEAILDSATSAGSGLSPMDLPVDAVQLPTAGIPVVGQDPSGDLVHDVVGQAPAGDLTDLQTGLPLDVSHTLDTVNQLNESVLDTVNNGATSDLLQETGTSDLVGGSPLSDVVGQSPVSDVISLTQPSGATDLVSDVISLDDSLLF